MNLRKPATYALIAAVLFAGAATALALIPQAAPGVPGAADSEPTPSSGDAGAVHRAEGDEETKLAVHAPWPTCPLQCRMQYGFLGGSGGPEIEVLEGATRITVQSTWDARHPADAFEVHLVRLLEEKDGGRYWEGVAGGEGVGSVAIAHDAPEPGVYGVSSWQTTPAGADAARTIHHVLVVEY